MQRSWLYVWIVSFGLVTSGCATQSFVSESVRQSVDTADQEWRSSADSAPAIDGWLASFGDSVLKDLVGEALDNNPDIQAAGAAVARARAIARQAGARLQPQVEGFLESSRQRLGSAPAADSHQAGVRVSWELDVWGRVRSSRAAATAAAQAQVADLDFARLSLAAAVAEAYFLAIDAAIQESTIGQSENNLQRIVDVVRIQVREGVALRQNLAVTESDLAAVQSRAAGAGRAHRDALRALELLLGRYPGAELQLRSDLPPAPPVPPAGLPSTLLERRPDLIAAERRVAAAFHQLGQARAARLPRFSLTGLFGGVSPDLDSLVRSDSRNVSLGAGLLAPIFQAGALKAAVEQAEAEQQAAVAAYSKAAWSAFREVESALDAGQVLNRQEESLGAALDNAEEAFRIARLRFEYGDIDLLDLLSVEQRVFDSKLALSATVREALQQRVNLYLALGGQWQAEGSEP